MFLPALMTVCCGGEMEGKKDVREAGEEQKGMKVLVHEREVV